MYDASCIILYMRILQMCIQIVTSVHVLCVDIQNGPGKGTVSETSEFACYLDLNVLLAL